MSAQPAHTDEPPAVRVDCQTPQRSPDFWFASGNFVLVARQEAAYRVHGDVLARKSAVFSDLLRLDAVPRPDGEDMMDGCPIVHITDAPEDFSVFLGLVYDGFEHYERHVSEPRWATVRVMMLLGDKYDVPRIRAEGLRRLRTWYAEDIGAWDMRDEKFFARETDHLSVASITRTLGDPKLHAAVLYHCCGLPASAFVAGDPATGCPPLCAEDLIRVFAFAQSVTEFWCNLLDVDNWDPLDHVRGCLHCSFSTVLSILKDIVRGSLGTNTYKFIDLALWSSLIQEVEPHICVVCISGFSDSIRAFRGRSRMSLCRRFGL